MQARVFPGVSAARKAAAWTAKGAEARDFERARAWMVDAQVRTADVTDASVQAAMRMLAREKFAPGRPDIAYSDLDIEVAPERFLLRPRDLAKLLQALEPKPGDNALEIAGATGYGGAVLAAIGCKVVTLDADPALTHAAQTAISACGLSAVLAASGDVKAGFPDRAPYDLILVNGGVEVVAQAWIDQLAEGGRLAVIVRDGPAGAAQIYFKSGGAVGRRTVFDSSPPLIPGFAKPASFTF